MAFYHKYRPQKFEDLVGQDHIRQTLQNAVAQDRVAHAYLFAGPRGLGKTTTARLLAKAVNCLQIINNKEKIINTNKKSKITPKNQELRTKNYLEPCNECESCIAINKSRAMDVLEIDGASNRGIDEVRELRELVKFPPSQLRKKVVIIDEVHMLTKDAFNALLKTLEEPPGHIIFALATTEPHKIQATILSRVQRFDFKRPTPEVLSEYVKKIAGSEKIKITEDGTSLLGELADGSFRDGATLLEQISHSQQEEIGSEHIRQTLGLANTQTVEKLLKAVEDKNRPQAFSALDEFITSGGDCHFLLDQLIILVRKKLRISSRSEIARWLEDLVKAQEQQKYSPSLDLPIELFIVKQTQVQNQGVKSVDAIAPEGSGYKKPTSLVPSAKPPAPPPQFSQINEAVWHDIIEGIKQDNASLAAILKDSHLQGSKDNQIVIAVKYKFHKDKIQDQKNSRLLEESLERLTGKTVQIECILNPDFVQKRELMESGDILEDAMDVFSQ